MPTSSHIGALQKPAFLASLPRPPLPHRRQPPETRRRRKPAMSASPAPTLHEGRHLLAKAGPDGVSLGDCPFTMKANLALRHAGVSFHTHYIPLWDKPEWFENLTESASTPVFVDAAHVIPDSEEIVDYADSISESSRMLVREADPNWDRAFEAVSPLFGTLARFLKSEPEGEAACREKLVEALVALDAFLADVPGVYLLGDDISALDCNLGPKLLHVRAAAGFYKGFEIPEKCGSVRSYLEHMSSTEEWKAAACPDEVVVWGWSKFFK